MLFNSLEFLFFLPTVFLIYWITSSKNLKRQNGFILLSSYIFYGWWDWRFLTLIAISTTIDYFVGLKIYSCVKKSTKKYYLWISIFSNLSILGFFKYFNFFIISWIDFLKFVGFEKYDLITLKIILPVGISFYTFQTMSYSIDIYFKKLKPTKDFIAFASFVSFFPQLVAGPIERAKNLLPQIQTVRSFNYMKGVEGLRLILWGLFKKVVIADSLAMHVNLIFENYTSYNGGVLFLGLIYFSFQIYCDFSGYSDIAIGAAKLFGIELMSNFYFPFFSTSIPEFWRKWHISLSNWFRDYVFIPLSIRFRDYGIFGICLATILTYAIIGLWHGPNNKFIIFGLINALYFIPSLLIKIRLEKIFFLNDLTNRVLNNFRRLRTFILFSISLVFFRSLSVNDGFEYLKQTMFMLDYPGSNRGGMLFIFLLIFFEKYIHQNERDLFTIKWVKSKKYKQFLKIFIYYALVISIFHFSKFEKPFIYFQF